MLRMPKRVSVTADHPRDDFAIYVSYSRDAYCPLSIVPVARHRLNARPGVNVTIRGSNFHAFIGFCAWQPACNMKSTWIASE
jgi:hypothetical protein